MQRRRWKNWRRPGFYQRFGQNVMLFHKAWQVGWQSTEKQDMAATAEPCKNPPFKGRAKDTLQQPWVSCVMYATYCHLVRPGPGSFYELRTVLKKTSFWKPRVLNAQDDKYCTKSTKTLFVACHVRFTLLFDPLDCTARCISGILIQTKGGHRAP